MAPYPHPAGGGGRIRTYEGISQQIYSLPPLAAWVPLLKMSRVFCGASPPLSMRSLVQRADSLALHADSHELRAITNGFDVTPPLENVGPVDGL